MHAHARGSNVGSVISKKESSVHLEEHHTEVHVLTLWFDDGWVHPPGQGQPPRRLDVGRNSHHLYVVGKPQGLTMGMVICNRAPINLKIPALATNRGQYTRLLKSTSIEEGKTTARCEDQDGVA